MSKKTGLTTNGEAGRAFRSALRSVPYCPISGNQPTRMTKASFLARCAREQARDPYSYSLAQYCGECRGQKVPAEISFIELEELKGGVMQRPPTNEASYTPIAAGLRAAKVEKCQSCGGEKKQLRPASGIRACPSCSVIINAAKNRPEMVLAQLERLGKLPPVDTVATCEHCSSLLENIKLLDKVRMDLEDALGIAERNLEAAMRDLRAEREISGQLAAQVDELKDAFLHDRAPLVKGDLEQTAPGRDSLLLDLALDILDGKVTGLDAGRLSAMRGVV